MNGGSGGGGGEGGDGIKESNIYYDIIVIIIL